MESVSLVLRPYQWIVESAGRDKAKGGGREGERGREGSGEWAYIHLFVVDCMVTLVII